MNSKDDSTMNTKRKHDDFQTLWERRKQSWQQQAERTMPDDATMLRMSELARQQASQQATVVVPLIRRRNRWLPYAAAASLVIGIIVFGLTRRSQPGNTLPLAKEVTVGEQSVRFMCNNGCSAQEVLLAANDIIKE